MEVSIFRNVFDVSNPFQKDIYYVLDRIKKGDSKEKIEKIRAGLLKKNTLPGACFNGSFKYRSEEGLIKRSGFIILDFDKIGEDKVVEFKSNLIKDHHTFACWISPSGNGVKALFKIPTEGEFILYFNAIKTYFNLPCFDLSNKDIPRFCYESYDPDLYLNKDSVIWDKTEEPEIENIGSERVLIPIKSDHRIIENLTKWWTSKYGFVKGQRNSNLFILANAYNVFGVNQNDAENDMLRYIEKDLPQAEILKIIKSAYKYTDRHATRFFEDEKVKNEIIYQVNSGKTKKDIIKEIPGIDKETISKAIDHYKNGDLVSVFWGFDNKGNIKVFPHKYKFWLEQNNFSKYFPSKSNTFTFIKIDKCFVEDTNEKRLKDFVLNELMTKHENWQNIYDYMANSHKYFTIDFLSLLNNKNIEIKKDTKDSCFLYFKNVIIEVTKDNFIEIDYTNTENSYVWSKQIINRDFIKSDHHTSEYRTFLWLVSGQDVSRYNALKSVIGYLLHSYKTSNNNRAIILNDETISDNPNGGSGKGIFTNALSHLKKIASIDGKTFDFGKSFPYQTVSTDTQILVFDDVKKNFNFESLFSLITEGITLEYKGQDAIKLTIEESPKILISTNYTIGGIGGSFERRKFEVEFSDFFNFRHTPVDEFGHMLFDDWDDAEWSRFDNFMINCVQYYLKNGLIGHDFKNLNTRKFIKNTSFEFFEWVTDYNFSNRMSKGEVFNNFLEEYPDYKKRLTNKTFKKWIDYYCQFKNYKLTEGNSNGVRWFTIEQPKSELMPDHNDTWM